MYLKTFLKNTYIPESSNFKVPFLLAPPPVILSMEKKLAVKNVIEIVFLKFYNLFCFNHPL